MASLAFKLLLCLLVATVARAADEDSDSGQYNPELYEKPYETPETEEVNTEAAEAAETPEPPEPSEAEDSAAPAAPGAPAPLPEVVAAAPPVAAAPFPYPLLYAHQYNPIFYQAPHYLNPAFFPTAVL